ncbi:MAG: hypothetical protein J6Z12_03915 [Paludibacteraceae bacterium]|nr:hypothetical protein [Paludibacteraceae bacterium]
MDIQWIIVTAAIVFSVVYAVSRICRTLQGKNSCHCGCQCGCQCGKSGQCGCPCGKQEQ